jgi:Na+/melibiose symporter-like transporter
VISVVSDIFKGGGVFLMLYLFLSFGTGHPITIIGGVAWFIIGIIFLYLVSLFTLENLSKKKTTRNTIEKWWLLFVKVMSIFIVYPLCYLLFDLLKAFKDSTNKFFKDLRRL